jgi:ketosteroid isomerase-like protein
MKITAASLCLVALALATNASGGQAVGAEQAVMALEQQWLKSQQDNDTTLLAPLLADDIADTSTEGRLMIGKAAVIKDAKSVKWSSAEYRELRVTVHGDTAIVTGVFIGKGTDTAGKPVNVHERYTDAWTRMRDGKWLCVASHGSNIAT